METRPGLLQREEDRRRRRGRTATIRLMLPNSDGRDDHQEQQRHRQTAVDAPDAPVVVNRFQNRLRNMIVGRFADAATAKARPTRNAMFWFLGEDSPRTIARTPMTTVAIRATLNLLGARWACALLDHAVVEVVRERRRRLRASARQRQPGSSRTPRPQMTDMSTVPPIESAPPPSTCARSGAAELPPLVGFRDRSWRRRGAAAPKPRNVVMNVEGADDPDRPVHRGAGRPGGRHRVEPGEDVREPGRAQHECEPQRQQVDPGPCTCCPGRGSWRCRWPSWAELIRLEMLKLNFSRTRNEMRIVPPMSMDALMICTQVVAFMPPMINVDDHECLRRLRWSGSCRWAT